MSDKFTPGPWSVDGVDKCYVGADTVCGDRTEEEMHANARLMAAAPELLAAVRLLLTYHRTGGSFEDSQRAQKQALAAIAKAEGR